MPCLGIALRTLKQAVQENSTAALMYALALTFGSNTTSDLIYKKPILFSPVITTITNSHWGLCSEFLKVARTAIRTVFWIRSMLVRRWLARQKAVLTATGTALPTRTTSVPM